MSYRLIQKGPAFKKSLDVQIDASKNHVTVTYTENGKEKTATMNDVLPVDIANGILTTLIKNIGSDTPSTTVSMLAATPEPRLVKLVITPGESVAIFSADSKRAAKRFNVRVELGGLTGMVAPLVGKQPPDTQVWIIEGKAPLRQNGRLALCWRDHLAN